MQVARYILDKCRVESIAGCYERNGRNELLQSLLRRISLPEDEAFNRGLHSPVHDVKAETEDNCYGNLECRRQA